MIFYIDYSTKKYQMSKWVFEHIEKMYEISP